MSVTDEENKEPNQGEQATRSGREKDGRREGMPDLSKLGPPTLRGG